MVNPPARLLALATAKPAHVLHQDAVMAAGQQLFGDAFADIDRLLPIYAHAGIEQRASCVPLAWYLEEHGFAERNALFLQHGRDLLVEAADRCLEAAGLAHEDVDAIVAVSTSGIATPSLDALVMEERPFRRDTMRLPVFGLGCAGGVLGLSRAAAMARAHPGSRVLFLCVELCGLTFRHDDRGKSNFVATALFGDGAAAALLSCAEGGGPAVGASGEHTWAGSLDVMGWKVCDDGFGVLFSRDIPTIVRNDYRAACDGFLARNGLDLAGFDALLCHPGGAKVIAALEEVFAMAPGAMRHAREILRSHGNMSAVTILFVLEQALAQEPPGRWLLSSLGPGFTAAFLALEA